MAIYGICKIIFKKLVPLFTINESFVIGMEYKLTPKTKIKTVLVYSDLYREDDFNVEETLMQYNRLDLIRAISVLSFKYQDTLFPDILYSTTNPFFSNPKNKYLTDIIQRWNDFKKKNIGGPMTFVVPRTTLELMRKLLAIPPSNFKNQEDMDKEEYDIFRVLLRINQYIFTCKFEDEDNLNYITAIYLNQFSNNSLNNFSVIDSLSQMVYSKALFEAIETNPHYKHLFQGFLDFWKINSWKEYTSTVLSLFIITGVLKNSKQKGVGLIGKSDFPCDSSLLNKTIIDSFSIECNEICQESVDYKHLRERPIIKIGDFYMPINLQLLSEAMYNGIYFNLQNIYNAQIKTDNGVDFTNLYKHKIFEHLIFQRTMWKCLHRYDVAYPYEDAVMSDEEQKEVKSQPDFYIRRGNKVAIFECKAIRMNGRLKEFANEKELFEELRKKLYNKNHGTDRKLKATGVTQLMNFVENARNHQYEWDKPNSSISYYPILVLEDSSIIKVPFNTIMHCWQKEYMAERRMERVKPIIVMSVDTLILCSNEFTQKGFFHFFDNFLSANNKGSKKMKEIKIDADFRTFMQKKCPNCYNFDIFANTAKAICVEDNVPEPLQKCIDVASCIKKVHL